MALRTRNGTRSGFTMIELMIVMAVITILVSIAVPFYQKSIIRSKESVLKNNLFTMRTVIDEYTMDKGKAPQSLQDLVTEGYLRNVPVDPMTNSDQSWKIDHGRRHRERQPERTRHLRCPQWSRTRPVWKAPPTQIGDRVVYDVVIIGAGAAGLMCAAEATKRNRRVAVLEHNAEIGRKILISGGGRCNFTNVDCGPENYISSNPHFHKSALARYTSSDFIALVEKHRIPYHHKTLGQLFCDRSARDITSMLLIECRDTKILTNCRATEIRRTTHFELETSFGSVKAPVLVVACGGLSIPKMGATSFGYDIARQFGIKLAPTRPALVPLTWNDSDASYWTDLSGVATEVIAKANGQPVSREDAVHPSRTKRPGDSTDFFLLATGVRHRDRHAAPCHDRGRRSSTRRSHFEECARGLPP